MKLFYALASPYARKVLVVAHETGQAGALELIDAAPNPVKRDMSIVAHNPTGKVPTLVTDDGVVLYDSRVICQYLDSRHSAARLYPEQGEYRWRVLQQEALAEGLLDAALLARYETALRPAEFQWPEWIEGQMQKISSSIDQMQHEVSGGEQIDAGLIACACALSYLDYRFPDLGWRSGHAALASWYESFARRASMIATAPAG